MRGASEADRQLRSRLERFIHLSCSRQQTYPGCGKNLGLIPHLVFLGLGSYRAKLHEIQTIEDPKLPRKGKAPVRHKFGEQNTHDFSETPKNHYKRIYFNAIDTVMQCVTTRFEQKDFKFYVKIHAEDFIEVL